MTSRSLLPLPLVLASLALLAPATAAQAASRCAAPVLGVALQSTDPTAVQDDPKAVVRLTGKGVRVSDLRIEVRRGKTLVARGSLSGRLSAQPTAIALTAVDGRRFGAGEHRVTVTGRRAGCTARVKSSRTWRFGKPTLPVRATPMSPLTGDNVGALRLVVRPVGRQTVAGVRLRLLDERGATVAEAAGPATLSAAQVVDLPLAGTLAAGAYTLRVTGRRSDATSTTETREEVRLASGSSGAGAPPPTSGLRRQRAVVDWRDGATTGREAAGFLVPGIGWGEVVCKPDAQYLRIFPTALARETSMLTWTYKDWSENREKALREALHTAFTGPDFTEGLNKFSPTEKRSTGQFEALIADRGPFGATGGPALAPPTTLKLTWEWDFSGAGACHVEAELVTEVAADTAPLARSAQVVWHGDADAAGRDTSSVAVEGLGTLTLTCQADPDGVRRVTVDSPRAVTVTTREGSDDASVPQAEGPVTANLPNNGMLLLAWDGGATALISSRWKVNDPDGAQNSCAIAAQVVVPG